MACNTTSANVYEEYKDKYDYKILTFVFNLKERVLHYIFYKSKTYFSL